MFMKILFNYQGECVIRANGPDTIRSHKPKQGQHNDQKKKDKNNLQNTHRKLDIEQHEPYKNPERVFLW